MHLVPYAEPAAHPLVVYCTPGEARALQLLRHRGSAPVHAPPVHVMVVAVPVHPAAHATRQVDAAAEPLRHADVSYCEPWFMRAEHVVGAVHVGSEPCHSDEVGDTAVHVNMLVASVPLLHATVQVAPVSAWLQPVMAKPAPGLGLAEHCPPAGEDGPTKAPAMGVVYTGVKIWNKHMETPAA